MSEATQARVQPGRWSAVAGLAWPGAVFIVVLAAQLALVAVAGTDIPFHDQWNIEGEWLYPGWCDGTLRPWALLQPFNEHRILWTHLLNLGLFVVNGQWDPLVQLGAIAVLRAACAGGFAWGLMTPGAALPRWAAALLVAVGFLPLAAWHNVLWGIESHAYFSLGLGLLALRWLGAEQVSARHAWGGLAAALAGLVAMGPGALVPAVLLVLLGLRAWERREWPAGGGRVALAAGLVFGLAWWLRTEVPEHAGLRAHSIVEFVTVAGRVLAWPHAGGWPVAIALNLPILLIVGQRLARRRRPGAGEDFVLLAGGWSAAIGLATAWVRGGSPELLGGVPSRYADFLVLLPLANAWGVVGLVREASARWRPALWLGTAWLLFLLLGWAGLGADVMRGLVLPRAQDRAAPVRLVRAFQTTGDAAVFRGQPLLLVPHPNPESVRAVLHDPRLRGALPPSLQPEYPPGPLSRAVRAVVGPWAAAAVER